MRSRVHKLQGVGTLKLEECLHLVCAQKICVPRHTFEAFPGSSAGTMIGPIKMPDPGATWQLQWSQKKALYKNNIQGVGGNSLKILQNWRLSRKLRAARMYQNQHFITATQPQYTRNW